MQLVVYLAVLLALAWPLARLIDAVMAGRFALGRRLEAPLFRVAGVQPGAGVRVAALCHRPAHLQWAGRAGRLRPAAAAGRAAVQSAGVWRGVARLGLQHRDQLRHQHQLAGLWRRDHDELPDADAGADGAELPVRGHRHRRGDRAGARFRAPLRPGDRQRVGRPDPRDAVDPAAAVLRLCAGAGRVRG